MPTLHFNPYSAPLGRLKLFSAGEIKGSMPLASFLYYIGAECLSTSPSKRTNREMILPFRTTRYCEGGIPISVLESLTGCSPKIATSFIPIPTTLVDDVRKFYPDCLVLMIIEWTEELVERVGIVLMYDREYVKLKPKVKHIRLI